ncbi:MAG TPA: type II toxin-antitoxin system RelE/ParE family toxin [Chthoniobacterales bacterium]|jgi:mRNA interferase RelE/StbE
MTYDVSVTPAFKREFRKLERGVQKRVINALASLADEPRPHGVEKLKENPKFYRIPVGDYRIVYSVDDKKSVIIVCLVRHRRDAYRDIANLDIGVVVETLKPILVKPANP